MLGFAGEGPVHAVCCIKRDPGELFLITVYDPSRRQWGKKLSVGCGAYTVALPGTFTLCFSLVVKVCCYFGIESVERVKLKDEEVGDYWLCGQVGRDMRGHNRGLNRDEG
ncbi:MAG: hypothetical protein KGJ40_01580 [candidate division NC10 bacterium]|nr:hypothetical protein [candidate division NC10 bacterium]